MTSEFENFELAIKELLGNAELRDPDRTEGWLKKVRIWNVSPSACYNRTDGWYVTLKVTVREYRGSRTFHVSCDEGHPHGVFDELVANTVADLLQNRRQHPKKSE